MSGRPSRPPGSRLSGRADVLLTLLLVMAVACTAYAVSTSSARARAVQSVVVTPTPSAEPVTSLWFGDSIVEGCCRTDSAMPSMAQVAARRLGWAVPDVVGAGGTGYVTGRTRSGVRVGPYPERIAAAVDGAYYDVVVVAGGNNDANPEFDPVAFRAAVRAVLARVRTSLPDAELVVLGPYSPDGTGYVAQRQIESEEAARLGAVWIDQVAQGWMRDRPALLAPDGFHPDGAGHVELGVRAAAALQSALPATVLTAGTAATAGGSAPAWASSLVLPERPPRLRPAASSSVQVLLEPQRSPRTWR